MGRKEGAADFPTPRMVGECKLYAFFQESSQHPCWVIMNLVMAPLAQGYKIAVNVLPALPPGKNMVWRVVCLTVANLASEYVPLKHPLLKCLVLSACESYWF